jgi:hypothetical protein
LEEKPFQSHPATLTPGTSTVVNIPLSPLPGGSTPNPNQSRHTDGSDTATSIGYNRDFYQYEWFCGVIFSIVIFILTVAIWYLYQLMVFTFISDYRELIITLALLVVFPIMMLLITVMSALSIQDFPSLWFPSLELGENCKSKQKFFLRMLTCLDSLIILGCSIYALLYVIKTIYYQMFILKTILPSSSLRCFCCCVLLNP